MALVTVHMLGYLCDNIGLILHVFRVEVQMSLHQLAGISPSHPGSLSCLLYFLCVLAIPIFPHFKFEGIFDLLVYMYMYMYILRLIKTV